MVRVQSAANPTLGVERQPVAADDKKKTKPAGEKPWVAQGQYAIEEMTSDDLKVYARAAEKALGQDIRTSGKKADILTSIFECDGAWLEEAE